MKKLRSSVPLTIVLLLLVFGQSVFAGGRYYRRYYRPYKPPVNKTTININNQYPDVVELFSVAELARVNVLDSNLALRLIAEDRKDSARLLQSVVDQGYVGQGQAIEALKLQSYVQGVEAVTNGGNGNLPQLLEFRLEQDETGQHIYRRYQSHETSSVQTSKGETLSDIRPTTNLVTQSCTECHGKKKLPDPDGSFYLDVDSKLTQDEFELSLERIFSEDPTKVMPKGSPFSDVQKAAIVKELLLLKRSDQ